MKPRTLALAFLASAIGLTVAWATQPGSAVPQTGEQANALAQTAPRKSPGILQFDEVLELEYDMRLSCSAFVGPRVRLEEPLHSYPAGTLVRPVSYCIRTMIGDRDSKQSAGLYFLPLDDTRTLSSGGSLTLGAEAARDGAGRRMSIWTLRTVDGRPWGEVTSEADLKFGHEWSAVSDPDRSKGVPMVPTPK